MKINQESTIEFLTILRTVMDNAFIINQDELRQLNEELGDKCMKFNPLRQLHNCWELLDFFENEANLKFFNSINWEEHIFLIHDFTRTGPEKYYFKYKDKR